MANVKLKKSLQVVLENSKQAVVKVLAESMLKQPAVADEIAFLLLEFTLEYPFPPTAALAQKKEVEESDPDEHPLLCYNAADLELFSEDQTIVIDFAPYEELFETADQLLEEIEYEDRQPFIFQLYVDVCKALMLESANWKHLNLAADFHVTARDYEISDEAEYLKKLLPKKSFNKIQQKLDAYNAKLTDEYATDETIIKVNTVMEAEAERYEELLATLAMDTYTDVYTREEICFMQPYYVEMHMHKRPEDIERELSIHKPLDLHTYYQYKFNNNIPQLVDFYYEQKLIWRKIFQYKEAYSTSHKFFLKSGVPEIEDYKIVRESLPDVTLYETYMDGHYDLTTYHKNTQGQITDAVHVRSMFDVGYKMDATFTYAYAYKDNELFKISSINQNGQRSVPYCRDESFMEEAMEDFIEHICRFTLSKMKEHPLVNLNAVVLEYDHSLAFYFTVYLVLDGQMENISTYELHEDDSAMMNLTVYTSASPTSPDTEYFSREKSEAYVQETYTRLCSTLSERILDTFQLSVPVVCKYLYDDLDL